MKYIVNNILVNVKGRKLGIMEYLCVQIKKKKPNILLHYATLFLKVVQQTHVLISSLSCALYIHVS